MANKAESKAKKTPAKAAAKKPAAKKSPAAKAKDTSSAETASVFNLMSKDQIMSKTKETAANIQDKAKKVFADVQTRAKGAYAKGAEMTADFAEFQKENAGAVVESVKIYGAGVQDLAKEAFEDSKEAVGVVSTDVQELAAVRSPTEFFELQSKIASRNVDAAVKQFSKSSEAWFKLANDSFAPLSSRASVAMEKVRKVA